MSEVQDARDVRKTFIAPTIKPFDHYDFSRAKICCSLTWLVAKAYGTGRRIFTLHVACISVYLEIDVFRCILQNCACQHFYGNLHAFLLNRSVILQ